MKLLLLFMIVCIIGISSSTLQNAQAFTLQDSILDIDIFGNFLKKTAQGVACFTSQVGKIAVMVDRAEFFDGRVCGDFP